MDTPQQQRRSRHYANEFPTDPYDLQAMEDWLAARAAKRAHDRKMDTYVRTPIRVALTLAGIAGGYALAHRNLDERATAQRVAVTYDDETIRAVPSTPIEVRLGKIAAQISGKEDVAVICHAQLALFDAQPKDDYTVMGVTLYGNQTTSKKPDILLDSRFCAIIEDPSTAVKPEYVAKAVFSFAHELGHLGGEQNEGKTNCLAVDLFPQVADSLGLTDLMAGYDPQTVAEQTGSAVYHAAGC
jgi:hypothetical protein